MGAESAAQDVPPARGTVRLPGPTPGAAARARTAGLGPFLRTLEVSHEGDPPLAGARPEAEPMARRERAALTVRVVALAACGLAALTGPNFLWSVTGHGAYLLLYPAEVVGFLSWVAGRKPPPPRPETYLHLYRDGLSLPWADGSLAVPWDEIVSDYEDIDRIEDSAYHYRIRHRLIMRGGRVIRLEGIAAKSGHGAPSLHGDVCALTRVLRSRALDRVRLALDIVLPAGGTLRFGPVSVASDGLTLSPFAFKRGRGQPPWHPGGHIPWEDLRSVKLVGPGALRIRTARATAWLATRDVPELAALWELLRDRSPKSRDSRPSL
ncbi:hypothetical protein AB0M28_03425 [Streptomyces sp. NPDC051940]|uniref:hypothetical protein n=1 Tax=Streptomyces sp. NPDC051940 TaxID=3155675 RepID=UPI0034353B8D